MRPEFHADSDLDPRQCGEWHSEVDDHLVDSNPYEVDSKQWHEFREGYLGQKTLVEYWAWDAEQDAREGNCCPPEHPDDEAAYLQSWEMEHYRCGGILK
jgi:hypothetical protein